MAGGTGLFLRQSTRLQTSLRRAICASMTIEDIEKAIASLPGEQLDRFRAWFEAFDAARFDEKIEHDAANGKLDRAARHALAEHRQGRTREL